MKRRVSTLLVGEVEAMMSMHLHVDARFDALDFHDAKNQHGDRVYLEERQHVALPGLEASDYRPRNRRLHRLS